MSADAMKWVMEPDETWPVMSAEQRSFLVHLAWRARPDTNVIETKPETVAEIAALAGITLRAARLYMRDFRACGAIRDTGARLGETGRVVVHEITMQWAEDAASRSAQKSVPNSASTRTISKRANGASTSTITEASEEGQWCAYEHGNSAGIDTAMVHVQAKKHAPTSTITTPPLYNGLQELQETQKENLQGGSGTARVLQRAATASTSQPTVLEPARASDMHVQQQRASRTVPPHESEETTLEAIVAMTEVRGRDDPAKDWADLERRGAALADLRTAVGQAAGKSKAPKPHWRSVVKVLDATLLTRKSAISAYEHRHSAEVLDAARTLESTYLRHFDPLPWTATRARCDFGDWLCRAVANDHMDEIMFEAACLDAKAKANG
ncbi:MAG TPA: hypothetical protein VJU59_29745, partial [Paraburkholderia sp.]|uniref:hypothetical protein n=1 Tax=Paraburkholderia sp. TaxID=1926495 RepID=UPI002B473D86